MRKGSVSRDKMEKEGCECEKKEEVDQVRSRIKYEM